MPSLSSQKLLALTKRKGSSWLASAVPFLSLSCCISLLVILQVCMHISAPGPLHWPTLANFLLLSSLCLSSTLIWRLPHALTLFRIEAVNATASCSSGPTLHFLSLEVTCHGVFHSWVVYSPSLRMGRFSSLFTDTSQTPTRERVDSRCFCARR